MSARMPRRRPTVARAAGLTDMRMCRRRSRDMRQHLICLSTMQQALHGPTEQLHLTLAARMQQLRRRTASKRMQLQLQRRARSVCQVICKRFVTSVDCR